MRTTLAMLGALLLTAAASALAQTRYGTVLLNNYDSGKGGFWYACPAPVGTIVEVLGGVNASSLSPISSTSTASSYTIKEGDVNALGPGTGSFFDYGFGSVPGVLPGRQATFLVRIWYRASSYDSALIRGPVTWTQSTGTNPDPPELPQPAVLAIPNTLWMGALAAPAVRVSPLSQVILGGQTAIFTATADGGAPTYQWHKDGAELKDATNATLTLTNVRRTDAGVFDVTLICASYRSSAVLRVLVPQRFEAPTLLADGRMRLPFRDQDGDVATLSYATNYFVPQISTNLVDWQTASGSLSLTNGFLVFEDATPLALPSRFYRILER